MTEHLHHCIVSASDVLCDVSMLQHRDLTFKNMLIQESDRNASNPSSMLAAERNRSASPDSTFKLRHQYDLTVIDFGASRYYGEEIHRIDAGNQGYSDLHTLCEAFFLKIYGRYDDTGTSSEGQGHTNGNVLSSRNPIPKSHQSLQYVLMLCMQHNSDKTRVLTKQAVAEVELLVSGVSQA